MPHRLAILLYLFTCSSAWAITLTAGQSDYTTSADITTTASNTAGAGINSTQAGTSSSPRKIKNIHIITTSGSGADGIRTTKNYNQITNEGTISTSSSSAHGIDISGDFSSANNSGTISSVKYAIYNNSDNTVITNSGTLNGGVRIGNGTLNISGGSISGTVEGSDVGNVNITGNFTQTSAFNNLASFNISSGATFTMNSTYALDADEISGGGTLNISSGSSFTPKNNTTLGNISVGGTLDLSETNNLTLTTNLAGSGSGVIDLGTNDQKISGNFSLNSGDTLKITGNKNGFGSLEVSGTATVDANAKLIISSANKYLSSGEKITLVSGGSGSALGQISDIQVNNCTAKNCGLLKLTTEISGNNLLLDVDHVSADEIAVNNNSKKIYKNLNTSETSGKMHDFLAFLDSKNFSNDELQETLTQLAPTSGKGKMIGNVNVVSNSLKTGEIRLDQIRAGADELPAYGTNFAAFLSPNNSFTSLNLDQQGGMLKNGFWVQPFGGSATQNATAEDVGYRTILSGVAFGIDREFSPQLTSGAAFSLARSETKSLDSLKRTSAITYQLNLYNSQNFGKFFFDSLGGIAFSQYSSNRAIPAVSATATASYTGLSYTAKLRAGMTKKINRQLNFIPEMSLGFLRSENGGYTEKGADSLNLKVSSNSSNILEGRIGAGLSWSKKIRELSEFRKITAALKTSYGYNFINQSDDVVSSFSGQNSTFNSQVSPIDPGSFRIGAELTGYHIEDTIFSLDYQFEKRITYQSHFVALKVRQEF